MTDIEALQIQYGLSPSLAKALLLLTKNGVSPFDFLEGSGIVTDTRGIIHRLRRRLKHRGMEVHSQQGVGYWLDKDTRAKVFADIKEMQAEIPDGDQYELPFEEDVL